MMRRVLLFLLWLLSAALPGFAEPPDAVPPPEAGRMSDEALLDEIQRRALHYFLEERNAENGLIRDWAWSSERMSQAPATIAATGFALSAYAVGAERGWLARGEAADLARLALQFLKDGVPQQNGFFYHFLTFNRGARVNGSELSPIDTALAAAGMLFSAAYFNEPEISKLARDIWERIDWQWMLNGGGTFALAWTPETGFFKNRWAHYDESTLLYLLALGSPTHPIPRSSWHAVKRIVSSYKGYVVIQSPPLFTHQYPHIWIDFRNRHDRYADYFKNSAAASRIHRKFAMEESKTYRTYGPDVWGLTAAEGPKGYKAYGAPPGWAVHDGTIAPTGCVSSIVFTPAESLRSIRHLYETFGEKLWGRYGFADAFNLDEEWFSNKVFAINQGPMILMIENYRSGLIWKTMNRLSIVKNGLEKAGFQEGTMELALAAPPASRAPFLEKTIRIDGDLSDWPEAAPSVLLDTSFTESGTVSDVSDASLKFQFAWDREHLFFAVEAKDDSLVLRQKGDLIWRDDAVELFIDPEGDGLYWGHEADFQFGFRPEAGKESVRAWSWFGKKGNLSDSGAVRARASVRESGFTLEAAVRWPFLGIVPERGQALHITPMLHDIDMDRSEGKLAWFFQNRDDLNRFELGRVTLS